MDIITGIPFYEEGKALISKAKSIWDKYSNEQILKQMNAAQHNLGNPNLYNYLGWKYPTEPILKRCGEIYPVAVYPASGTQINKPESVLGKLEKKCPADKELEPKDATYRELSKRLGVKLIEPDRLTFTMREMNTSSELKLKCELGSYFRALDTCDSLEWEILSNSSNLTSSKIETLEKFDKKLRLRSLLHSIIKDPIRNGSKRSAAIAISTLIAYPDQGRMNLLLRRRSRRTVAVHPNLIHVIPSFMFQPATVALNEEYSVMHNFYREYLEELFNRPEPEETEGDWRYFYNDPRLNYLTNFLNTTHEAEFYFSGMAVNLLNLRPEICTVLYIKTDDWYQHHAKNPLENERFHYNIEWANVFDFSTENLETLIGSLPYTKNDNELRDKPPLKANRMVPPGAAAFWLGLDVLRQVIN